ncbi:uncharacterized protein DSM5745_00674 [Aspergillus mulundensis]|uniref:Uncharacterized protein n=1 Tax=Aspergillus mulundensis TaxID=1810919 RepID=A0A3D8T460_9EURO|nr:Uncharacterized protein DSM5745_00674 [Aspergillus mulundensis]RDW93352.1 Uncharacterized protein DSM5745_00674 [Aspergillus mulundensis]
MAEFKHPVHTGFSKPGAFTNCPFWARSQVKYAQDLLDYSTDPIEYEHDDEDYWDNHFFFPEDCSWSPPKDWALDDDDNSEEDIAVGECYDHDNTMIPGLPDIKMLDAEALSDLLEDNLSPPEITSIFVFATNGAIFAYASSLPSRQLRNLSATYGAAYTCYAKNASSGNLTGVNPASHPSSYVTAQSVSLGDVGSIVFELDDLVAVVTRIADKVLLAAVGPSKIADVAPDSHILGTSASKPESPRSAASSHTEPAQASGTASGTTNNSATPTAASTPQPQSASHTNGTTPHTAINSAPTADASGYLTDAQLQSQYEVDRTKDLERLASLNLSTPPSILLALESKSAALGRFLSQKLEDLASPDDF